MWIVQGYLAGKRPVQVCIQEIIGLSDSTICSQISLCPSSILLPLFSVLLSSPLFSSPLLLFLFLLSPLFFCLYEALSTEKVENNLDLSHSPAVLRISFQDSGVELLRSRELCKAFPTLHGGNPIHVANDF